MLMAAVIAFQVAGQLCALSDHACWTHVIDRNRFPLKLGLFSKSGQTAYQPIVVKNDSDRLTDVRVECGFFRGETLVTTESTFALKIAPGANAYVNVMALNGADVDHAECRSFED